MDGATQIEAGPGATRGEGFGASVNGGEGSDRLTTADRATVALERKNGGN